MAYEWQTVEQAAVTLGISARTLARRISKGDVENRLHNGRREVFICLADEEPEPVVAAQSPLPEEQPAIIDSTGTAIDGVTTTSAVTTASEPSYDPNMTHALIVAEDRARRAEMAIIVIQQSTQLVQHEVARARPGARWAWTTVAVLAIGAMVAVAWTTEQVTNSRLRNEHLQERATFAAQQADKLAHDNEALRDRNELALQAVARTTGELEEVHRELRQTRSDLQVVRDKATTQPSSLAKRLVTAVIGD